MPILTHEEIRKMLPSVEVCIREGRIHDSIVASIARGRYLTDEEKDALIKSAVAHRKALNLEGKILSSAEDIRRFLDAIKPVPRREIVLRRLIKTGRRLRLDIVWITMIALTNVPRLVFKGYFRTAGKVSKLILQGNVRGAALLGKIAFRLSD